MTGRDICAKTFGEQASAYIKERLLAGSLRPGDQIREVEIAESLGISRGPVREALHQLVVQGLVTGDPQKPKFIRDMSAAEIIESYCLGGTLEGACIVQSLGLWDKAAFARLWAILEEMRRQSATASGLVCMSSIDEAFHEQLMALCVNRLMVRVARDSCAHISKFLYYRAWDTLFSPLEFYGRHKTIYQAVESLDSVLIQNVLLEHYRESGRRLARVCGRRN